MLMTAAIMVMMPMAFLVMAVVMLMAVLIMIVVMMLMAFLVMAVVAETVTDKVPSCSSKRKQSKIGSAFFELITRLIACKWLERLSQTQYRLHKIVSILGIQPSRTDNHGIRTHLHQGLLSRQFRTSIYLSLIHI